MNRDGIVDATANAPVRERLQHTVPLAHANGVEVIDVLRVAGFLGQDDLFHRVQKLRILRRAGAPGGVAAVQELELDAKDRALDAVHAAVPAHHRVVVFAGLAVVPEHADLRGQFRVIGGDRAGLAEGAEVLAGIEAEAAGHTEGAGFAALVEGAVRLAGILDHRQAVPPGDLQDRVHVGRLPEKMDREDGLGPRRDGLLDQVGVHGVGLLVDIDEDRLGPAVGDGLGGGHEGARDGDRPRRPAPPRGPARPARGRRCRCPPRRQTGCRNRRQNPPRTPSQTGRPQRRICRSPPGWRRGSRLFGGRFGP